MGLQPFLDGHHRDPSCCHPLANCTTRLPLSHTRTVDIITISATWTERQWEDLPCFICMHEYLSLPQLRTDTSSSKPVVNQRHTPLKNHHRSNAFFRTTLRQLLKASDRIMTLPSLQTANSLCWTHPDMESCDTTECTNSKPIRTSKASSS